MSIWQKATPALKNQMKPSTQQWLLKPYVLSKHLKAVALDYQFERLSQGKAQFHSDESSLLGVSTGIIREIAQKDADQVLVFGRVCIPEKTYLAYEAEFGSLAENPIGESLLYFNPEVRRGPFQYAQIPRSDKGFAHCFAKTKNETLWARRSLFYWRGFPLLVTEVFMPDLPPFIPVKNMTRRVYQMKEKLLDYAYLIRLHRPIPIFLMLWPTLWALWLAADGWPGFKFFIIFALGVLFMRSCGDILNDLADRNFDGFIERTRMRPMATGRVSVKEALILAGILALISFVMVLFLNGLTIALAFVGMALAVLYPFMKRVTYLPQVVLGVAYNWGVIMAYAAVQGRVPVVAWYILLVTVIWTVAYDTFYAMADLPDDLKQGIKSTAVLFHPYNALITGLLQLMSFIGFIGMGFLCHMPWPYYIFCCCCIPFFIYQQRLIRQPTIKRCIGAFSNNHWVGLCVFLGVFISSLFFWA